jgi:hypothetical protein
MYTHHEISRLLRGFDHFQMKQAALQQQTKDPEFAKRNFVTVYRFARPVLMGFTASPLYPAVFRAVIGALVAAADLYFNLNPPPAAPAAVEAAASSDTTTTDPTSTDPSFKAGKDL